MVGILVLRPVNKNYNKRKVSKFQHFARQILVYKMEIVNRVSAFQNYQKLSDVIADRPKPASENSERLKASKWNSVIVFRLWRHDDHAD